jgi:hypothetical protein
MFHGIYRIVQCLKGTTLLPSVFCSKKRENKCNSLNLPVSTQSWTTDRNPIVLQISKGLKAGLALKNPPKKNHPKKSKKTHLKKTH